MTLRAYLGTTLRNGVLCVCWLIDGKTAYLYTMTKNERECGLTLAMQVLEQIGQDTQIIVNSCDEKILRVPKAKQVITVQHCQHLLINKSFKLSYDHVSSLKLDTLMIINL